MNEVTVSEEHKKYLDELRESGITNMFGAGRYLADVFNIGKREADKIVQQWMKEF